MSEAWFLVCLNDLTALPLGKLVLFDEEGHEVRPWFQGRPDTESNRWTGTGELLLSGMQAFHAQHLGHLTGTVEWAAFDAWLEEFQLDYEAVRWVDDIETILDRIPDTPENQLITDAARQLEHRLRAASKDV